MPRLTVDVLLPRAAPATPNAALTFVMKDVGARVKIFQQSDPVSKIIEILLHVASTLSPDACIHVQEWTCSRDAVPLNNNSPIIPLSHIVLSLCCADSSVDKILHALNSRAIENLIDKASASPSSGTIWADLLPQTIWSAVRVQNPEAMVPYDKFCEMSAKQRAQLIKGALSPAALAARSYEFNAGITPALYPDDMPVAWGNWDKHGQRICAIIPAQSRLIHDNWLHLIRPCIASTPLIPEPTMDAMGFIKPDLVADRLTLACYYQICQLVPAKLSVNEAHKRCVEVTRQVTAPGNGTAHTVGAYLVDENSTLAQIEKSHLSKMARAGMIAAAKAKPMDAMEAIVDSILARIGVNANRSLIAGVTLAVMGALMNMPTEQMNLTYAFNGAAGTGKTLASMAIERLIPGPSYAEQTLSKMSIFTGNSLLGSIRTHLSLRAFQLRVVNDQPRISEEFAEPEKTLTTERFCKRDATSFVDGIRESTVDMTCAPQAPAVISTNFPAPDALADRITSIHVDPRMMTGSFGKNSSNPLLNPDIPEITMPLHAVVNCNRVLFLVMRVFTEVMPSPAWVSTMNMPGISHRAQLRIDVVSARTAAINSATCLLVCHNPVWYRFTQAQRLLWAALPVIEPQTVARCMMTSISNQDVRVSNSWLLVLSELASVVDPFDEDIPGFYRWIAGGIPSHFENQVLACKAKAYGLAVERHGSVPLITQLQEMHMLNIGTLIIRDKTDKVISSKQSVSIRGNIMSAFVPLHFIARTRELIALLKDSKDLFRISLCCEHDTVPNNDGTYAMTEFMLIAPPMMRWLCNQPVQSISDTMMGTVTSGKFPAMRRFLRSAAPLRCEGMWAYLTNAGAIPPSSSNMYIINACSTTNDAAFRPEEDKATKCFRIPMGTLANPVINAHPVVKLFSETPRWSDPVYNIHMLNGTTVDVPITTNRMAGTVTRSSTVSPLLSEKMENTVWPDSMVDTRLVLMITSLTALMAKDTHNLLLAELTDEHYDLHPQFGNCDPNTTMDKIPWILPPETDDTIIESEGHVTIFTRALIVLWCASAFKIRHRLRFFDSLQTMLAAYPPRLASSWKCISTMCVKTVRPSKLKMMIEALPAFLDTIDASKTAINRDTAAQWALSHTHREPADAGGVPLKLASS